MSNGSHLATQTPWLGEPEAVYEFLTIAVHDLREPLRAIRSSSELLAEMQADSADESAARYVRFISDGVDRMEGLIRDIAECCYGELREMAPAETDLQNVLTDARRQLSDEFKKNEAVFTHDPLPAVMGDASRLVLLFRGLLENACKFRGEAAPRIHLGVKQTGAEWVFSVRDNGQGFNPIYAERVFKPFERLNGKQYPGSGLGLTLARRILEQHGGRIWAESQLGRGCTFWFTLPVAD